LPSTIHKLQNFALQPMEISKWYISVPVKDNCALLHLPPIFGPTLSDGVIWISHPTTLVAMATNFGTKIDYNSVPVKDNCSLFAPTPLIRSC